jgi:hypothetical protein
MSHASPSPTTTPPRPSAPRAATKKAPAPAGPQRSAAARRRAAAVLEVLAGARTPADAAVALGLSLAHYYHLEGRALQALVSACEPLPVGRQPDPGSEARALRQQCQRLQQQLARQQALTRLAQRTVGLAPPVAPKAVTGKKRRRRPSVRALRVAGQLRQGEGPAPPATVATAVQPPGPTPALGSGGSAAGNASP